MFQRALLLLSVVIAGCSVAGSDTAPEHLGISRQKMVGGSTSPTSQDSVIFLMKGEDESCSGTLIAPNLVLTARHCVATPNDSPDECVGYGTTVTPDTMSIKVGGSSNWDVGTVAGIGKKIITPTTANLCGYDVALIILDRDVKGAKISPVRFTALAANEPTVTVGYGVDGNDNDLPKRMQRTTTVLGVGPANIAYTMKDGNEFDYATPTGDVVTGESTCFGDSGGPLFDMKGNVVAMTSRGPADAPEGGAHGNGCIDMVSVYSGARFNEATIRAAATEAGHPLPTAGSDATTQSSKGSTSAGDDDDDDASGFGDDDDDDDDSRSGDDDDDDSSKTKKKSSGSSSLGTTASGGCSAAPTRAMNGDSWLLLGGVALVLAVARRRRATS